MNISTKRVAAAAAAGLVLAGGAFLAARRASAQDKPVAGDAKPAPKETAREAVERLFPDLLADDAAARDRAERAIAALGEPARAELDRIARDPDPKRALAALRMLQSERWERTAETRNDDGRIVITPPKIDVRRWQEEIQREFDEMRRRMEEWRRDVDLEGWMPQVEHEDGAAVVRGHSSGTVVENGRSLRWDVDEAGKVKVTTKDSADAPEQTAEAPNLEEFRKEHPELAKRLDAVLPRTGGSRLVIRWPARRADREAPRPQAEREEDGREVRGPGISERDGVERLPPSENPFALPGPTLGIAWSPVPDVLREQLDLAEGGMVVDAVTPNTLAERLGMRRNDVLVRLGGRAIAGPADVRKALESAADGAELKADVLRKGRTETLTAKR